MDYGRLVGDAWRVTWGHRYLWLFGLFSFTTGSCSGGGPSYQFGGDFGQGTAGDGSGFWTAAVDFVTGNTLLSLTLLGGILLAFLFVFVLAVISTPALIAGTDIAHSGRAAGLTAAWRTGLGSVWRLVGLWLFLLLLGGGVLVAITLAFLLPLGLVFAGGGGWSDGGVTGLLILMILGGVFLLLLLVPLAIALQIWLNLTQRSLILEGAGVFASMGKGWRLFRHNLGRCLVLWVLDAALSFGLALLLAVPFAALAIPAFMGLGPAASGSPPVVALFILGGLLALGALGVAKAIGSTYFAAYWTIAYRELQPSSVRPSMPDMPAPPVGWAESDPPGRTGLRPPEGSEPV